MMLLSGERSDFLEEQQCDQREEQTSAAQTRQGRELCNLKILSHHVDSSSAAAEECVR
jgi:hypothetical protein